MKHKKYVKHAGVTNHSIRRSKGRVGDSKADTLKKSRRAWVDGIDKQQTKGSLRKEMDKHYGTLRYYANAIYVFSRSQALVTVLDIDLKYDENLIKYVTWPIFFKYKTKRYAHKKDKTKMNEDIKIANEYIMHHINSKLEKGECLQINHLGKYKGEVVISEPIEDKLRNKIKEKYGLIVRIADGTTGKA